MCSTGLRITTTTAAVDTTTVLFTAVARTSKTTRDPSLGCVILHTDVTDRRTLGPQRTRAACSPVRHALLSPLNANMHFHCNGFVRYGYDEDGSDGGGGGRYGNGTGGYGGGLRTTTPLPETSAASGPPVGLIAGIIGGAIFLVLIILAVKTIRSDAAADKLLIAQVEAEQATVGESTTLLKPTMHALEDADGGALCSPQSMVGGGSRECPPFGLVSDES